MALITTQNKTKKGFLDLKITPTDSSGPIEPSKDFRHCTVTKSRDGHRYINLRLPDSVQDSILSAYREGKTVRIFA